LSGEIADAEQTELIYAALTSWGMHRMGPGGSKMRSFEEFKDSVTFVRNDIENLREVSPRGLTSSNWSALERVFKEIRVMASGTTIVGNSKVMAHLLPNLVAPIDREYTLKYLFGHGMFPNDLNREWNLMRKIHEEFYFPIADAHDFQEEARRWMNPRSGYSWDTSILKTIDNVVIGARRRQLTRKTANPG